MAIIYRLSTFTIAYGESTLPEHASPQGSAQRLRLNEGSALRGQFRGPIPPV